MNELSNEELERLKDFAHYFLAMRGKWRHGEIQELTDKLAATLINHLATKGEQS